MIALVPNWAQHYEEFWLAIRRRNLLFIRLRYAVVLMLIALQISSELFFSFKLHDTQLFAINSITGTILLYNIFFHWIRKYLKNIPAKFNPLHLSLLQILFDLTALFLLNYFTGSIESPFFMFYIFHMIIGSLILPGYVIYTIACLVIAAFSTLTILEYLEIIHHHAIKGLIDIPLYSNINYIVIFLVGFSLMMLISVFLANKIARQLYQREQQLREALVKLSDAEIAKQKYIMGVVHEIKTPIVAAQSFLEIIENKLLGPVNEAIEEKIKRAIARTEEALYLINNVLRISKLKLLNITTTEDLYLSEIILKLMEKVSENAKLKNIEIIFNDVEEKKIPVQGDKVLLELAFSNIIGNSVKYTQENGKIEISMHDSGDELMVEICDDGIGIPSDEMDKIFKQFYRASNVRQFKVDGSGLGLTLVKEIIERHNGEIEVKSPSRLGTLQSPGTSFILKIPYLMKRDESKK